MAGIADKIFLKLGQYPRLAKLFPYAVVPVAVGIDRAASFLTANPESLAFTFPMATALAWRAQVALFHRIELAEKRVKLVETKKEADEAKALLVETKKETDEAKTLYEASQQINTELTKSNTMMMQSLRAMGIMTVGDTIPFEDGRYTYKGKLGEGGMAITILVHDNRLNEPRVFKVPLPELVADENEMERFKGAEAKSMREINHPGIVRFFDLGEMKPNVYEALIGRLLDPSKKIPAKISFIIMEYVDSPTLDKTIAEQKKLEPYRALNLAAETAKTLQVVHRKGIIHRDLKAANIFLVKVKEEENRFGETVKIMDFGLAKKKREGESEPQPQYTMPNIVSGTPVVMAPEQWAGKTDWWTDQYALGAILCEMLTGLPPFGNTRNDEQSLQIYGQRVLNESLPKKEILGRVDLIEKSAEKLWSVLERMLAKSPEDRYQKWEDCIRDLEELITRFEPQVISLTEAPRSSKTMALSSLKLGGKGKDE